MEPIFFFISKFIKDNNLSIKDLMTVYEKNYRVFDKDGDNLLNREEFQFMIRSWAKSGFDFNGFGRI